MSLTKEIKELPISKPVLRKFGLLVGGIFLALGLWFLYRQKPAFWLFIIPGAMLFLPGVIYPASLRLVYLGWMSLALVLGLVVSFILLTLFFYLVVTPIGLIARLFGQDFLSLRLDKSAPSYWIARDPEQLQAESYLQQY